jgi:four helix bundle protein
MEIPGMVALPGFRDLKVYQLAFNLAMEIFYESKSFPPEEKYSLTDQIRRASRSVPGNIGEGYRKKCYPKMFVSKMADADGEATETQVWIDFAHACGYLSQSRQLELRKGYEEVGRMLGGMISHPERFSH